MKASRSPTTSEIASVSIEPRHRAASLPPLIALRCLRTVLISVMSAPEARSSDVTAALSARLTGSAGRGSRLEPPPDRRKRSRSSSCMASTSSVTRRAAATPEPSGTGWPDSWISNPAPAGPSRQARPRGTTTMPGPMRSARGASASSAPAVMAGAAFPTAATTSRPPKGRSTPRETRVAPPEPGRTASEASTAARGSAAASAARMMPSAASFSRAVVAGHGARVDRGLRRACARGFGAGSARRTAGLPARV